MHENIEIILNYIELKFSALICDKILLSYRMPFWLNSPEKSIWLKAKQSEVKKSFKGTFFFERD